MANILAVIDKDSDRRHEFVRSAAGDIAPVSGLKTEQCEAGPVTVLWAALENAPVDRVRDDAGGAVLWGDAIPGPGPGTRTAKQLRALWNKAEIPEPCDGFHAAVVWNKSGEIRLGVDFLGLFPLNWWSDGEVFLAGSSPELFSRHPRFSMQLDPTGLIGILLANGSIGGRTLWRDVRRLGAGRILQGSVDAGFSEEVQYELPLSARYCDLPFDAHVELMGEAMRDAMSRHAPADQPYGMLLSGGLDSRMLAGYLMERNNQVHAMTFGRLNDFEMRCARKVAQAMDAKHTVAEASAADYPQLADTVARWEHLSNGFNSLMDWGVCSALRQLPRRSVMGFLADSAVGGSHISYAYDSARREMAFEQIYKRLYLTWGLSPQALRQLLSPVDFSAALKEASASIKHEYFRQSFYQSWCLDLRTRQRLHVGATAWISSFGTWPVIPVLDRRLIEVAAGLPISSLADRRTQRELVMTRFPVLAGLPLDRNSPDTHPLRPRLRHYLSDFAQGQLHRFSLRSGNRKQNPDRDRRFYYRMYDINGPNWRAVRHHAEPHRKHLLKLCDSGALNLIWPAPDTSPEYADGIYGPSAMKMLMGLALLGRDHSLDWK
jgi:asparagine synthase (glutamine-hydrolysing)